MRVLLVMIALCLVSAPASAQDRLFRASLAAAVTAHGADLASTEYAIGKGVAHEGNPYLARFENPALFGAVKMGTAAGALWLTVRLHDRHPKVAVAVNLITTAVLSGVAAHNMRIVRGTPCARC